MQEDFVNNLTLEKHEMYCGCDAITKFSHTSTCMSKYIINENCCHCSSSSNPNRGNGANANDGDGNAESENCTEENNGPKHRRAPPIASNARCILSCGFCAKSNQILNGQRRRKRRRRSQWSSRWYFDFTKVLFVFVFCSNDLIKLVLCDRLIDLTSENVQRLPREGANIQPIAKNDDRYVKQPIQSLDGIVYELNRYKNHKTIGINRQHEVSGQPSSVAASLAGLLVRSDALKKPSASSNKNHVKINKYSKNINRKSSNKHNMNHLTKNIDVNDKNENNNYNDNINEHYKLPLKRLLHILSSQSNYSNISSSIQVIHDKIIYDSDNNYNLINSNNIKNNNKNNHYYKFKINHNSELNENNASKTNSNYKYNGDEDNIINEYSNMISNNNSNSTIYSSSHRFDSNEFHLRFTSKNSNYNHNETNGNIYSTDDRSINSNEQIKISTELSKLRQANNYKNSNTVSSYGKHEFNAFKQYENILNNNSSINNLTSIAKSLLNNNYSKMVKENDEQNINSSAASAVAGISATHTGKHFQLFFQSINNTTEQTRAPAIEIDHSNAVQMETTCLHCTNVRKSSKYPFDKEILNKNSTFPLPLNASPQNSLESQSLSSLSSTRQTTAVTAINSPNLSISKNIPISIGLRYAENSQKMHQNSKNNSNNNKYPKMTSNITKTTTKLMTNQKTSNNLIYVDENDVISSAPTIDGMVRSDNSDIYIDDGNKGDVQGQQSDNNAASDDRVDSLRNTREYVPPENGEAINSGVPLKRTTRKYLSTPWHVNAYTTNERENQRRKKKLNTNIFSNCSTSIENYTKNNEDYGNSNNNNNNINYINNNKNNNNDSDRNNDNYYFILLNGNNSINLSESIDNYKRNGTKADSSPHTHNIKSNDRASTRKNDKNQSKIMNNKHKTGSANVSKPNVRTNHNHTPIKYETGMPEMDYRRLSDDQMRLESIKYQILTKLGLKRKPNITQTLPRHIVMNTLSRANEARVDTTTARSHRGRFKTFDLYSNNGRVGVNTRSAHSLRGASGGVAIVNHINTNVDDYYDGDRTQDLANADNRAATPSGHSNATLTPTRPLNGRNSIVNHNAYNNGNQHAANHRVNKMRYPRNGFEDHNEGDSDGYDDRVADDGDSYSIPTEEDFDGDHSEDVSGADDFYGHTREIIIFAEKGELFNEINIHNLKKCAKIAMTIQFMVVMIYEFCFIALKVRYLSC